MIGLPPSSAGAWNSRSIEVRVLEENLSSKTGTKGASVAISCISSE